MLRKIKKNIFFCEINKYLEFFGTVLINKNKYNIIYRIIEFTEYNYFTILILKLCPGSRKY